jgi:hypothetical protein
MKSPNVELGRWLERSAMSRKELALRVKAAALARRQPQVTPDATTVRRWLSGDRPRPPVPEIVADVFSAHFGYRVTAWDLGFGQGPVAERSLDYNTSFAATVEAVTDLGRADVDRRSFLAAAPFAAAATVGPSRDWLLSALDQHAVPRHRVRLEDVTAVRNMFGEFQQLDVLQGGGTGRTVLAAYMNQHVFPLLRRTHTDDVRTALCEAAAEQTYLLGWMAYDSGAHGVAQRYLVQSLRLAEECRNPALGAHVLAGMSDQATLLGNPEEGRRLAQAGRAGLGQASPACLADLWALEGRALAKLGDRTGAVSAVVSSEAAFDRVRPDEEEEWAAFIDPAYLHGEHANTFRDLGEPDAAEAHARRSIDHARRQRRARRGAMSQAALAATHLQRGDLDAAHAAGLRTLDLSRQVNSTRCVEAVQDLQRRMRPFGGHHLITDFNARAREFTAAA